MSIININNYEEYMIDYLEDNLPSSLIFEMEAFLDVNPNIKEEIIDLKEVVLIKEDIKYSDKEDLYKDIDSSIFEDKCINYIEEQLTKKEQLSFLQETNLDAGKTSLLKDYEKTILIPDESIIYSNKEALKRNFPFKFKRLLHFSSAASIILAISMSILFIPYEYKEDISISKNAKIFNMSKEDIPKEIIENPKKAFKEKLSEVNYKEETIINTSVEKKEVVRKIERKEVITKINIKEIALSNILAYNEPSIDRENIISHKDIIKMSNQMTLNAAACQWQEESFETPIKERKRNLIKRSGDKIIGFLSKHFYTEKITHTKEIIVNE